MKKDNKDEEKITRDIDRIKSLNLDPSSYNKGFSMIYLNTLASFSDQSSGSFAMTSLKKMTATSRFEKMPDRDKKCHIVPKEECQMETYLSKVYQQCGCVPWALGKAYKLKVRGCTYFTSSPEGGVLMSKYDN